MSGDGLPDFTPRLLELQAKNTNLDHKVRLSTEYLERALSSNDATMDRVSVEMALLILKRKL